MINGKRYSFTADTKADAELLAAEFKAGRKRNLPCNKTVRKCIEEYIDLSEVLSATTLSAYKKILEFSFDSIMDQKAFDLTDQIVQNAINLEAKRPNTRTGKSISPKTVKNEWGLVASALKSICNLSFNVRLPKVQRKNEYLPEPEEIIRAISGSTIELPCLLAMWCGLRLSEIRGITFDSIKGDILFIDKVMVDVDGRSELVPYAKTSMSIRKIRLPKYLLDLIKPLYGPKNGLVIPYNRNYIYHHFKRLTKSAGIEMSFHDLRHVFASVMLTKLNVPEKIVQDEGGWSTPHVMKQVYSQGFTSSRIEADNLRDQYFSCAISCAKNEKIGTKIGPDPSNLAEDMGLEPTRPLSPTRD